MSSTTQLTALFAALLLAACGVVDEGGADPTASSMAALSMPAGDAQRVLDFVNYPGTDVAVLDEQVGLDRRAAEGIVAHRNGADGVCPGADDDLFGDLAELDAIPYVGDAAFSRLQAFSRAHPVPAGENVEGVDFTGWQAEAIVWGVNHATVEQLDVAVALDARAAANLAASAPYASVAQMGPIAYVGKTALEQLRFHAAAWWTALHGAAAAGPGGTFDGIAFDDATAVRALEIANLATFDQLVAHGLWTQGASAIITARPHADLAHVAAVSGVGAATMQALRAYATSGDWPPPPAECSSRLTRRADANAQDLDALLDEATMGDWPYMQVQAFQVPGCVNMGDAGARDAVLDNVIEQRLVNWAHGFPELLQYMSGDDFARGSALFVTRMDAAKQALNECVQGGYIPETPAMADRLSRLDAIHAALTDGPRSQPQSYWLASFRINAEECSEDAAILLDPATNFVWIVHRFPRC